MFPPVILTLEALCVKTRTVNDGRAPPCAHAVCCFRWQVNRKIKDCSYLSTILSLNPLTRKFIKAVFVV